MRILRCLVPATGLVLLVAASPLRAQPSPHSLDPALAFSQYTHDVWQRAEGLPQNTVAAMAQTGDGYLWLATQDGLVRFDGVRFTVFNIRTTPELGSNDIQALLLDRQDRLWIGTTGGGLVMLNHGKFTSYGIREGLTGNVVSALHEDAAGRLWIGTTAGGVSRLSDGVFQHYTAEDGLPSGGVTTIAHDSLGTIWIGTHSGLSKLADGRFTTYTADTGSLPSNDVRAVCAARDGTLWVATAAGLVRLRQDTFTTYTTKDGLSGNFVRTVFEDRAGTLWVGTVDGGVTRMRDAAIARFTTRDGLSDDDVRSFLEDDEGNLWIGTNAGGLNRLKTSRIVTYGTPEGLSHDIALAITSDARGDVWVATYGGGLNRLRDGRWTAYTTTHGLASNMVLSLAAARDGSLWVGSAGGVDRLRDGRVRHYGAEAGLADEPVLALLEGRLGDLWVGTRTGLKHVAASGTTNYTVADGLGGNIILAIVQTRDGSIWIGTEGGGVSQLGPDGLRRYGRSDGLTNDVVGTITEDREGDLWFGTNGGGLVRLKDGRFTAYTSAHGDIADTISRILEDAAGNLWMSANRGIFRVRRQDLDNFDAGTLKEIPTVWYDEADGMRSSEANGGIQPAGWQMPDGRLWFPTLKGAILIEPDRLTREFQPARAILEGVMADRQVLDHRAPLTVPAGARAIEFHYTAPGFQSPHRTAFRYRLDGYDAEWIEAGTRRTAYYTNLPPGDYVFRVTARNEDHAWSQAGPSLAIHFAPHFYQTGAFYALAAFGLLLAGFGAHRLRVSGLRAREHELVRLSEDRQRAIDALRASETQFRALFDNAFEGVYRTTPDGRILLANSALVTMLGYESADQLAGVNALDLYVRPGDRHRFVDSLDTMGEARDVEVVLRRPDGGHVTALESARAVRDAAGNVNYFEGTLVDVTDRKSLEEQNRQLQKMEIVGRLAGGIAHDFNNLLTPILGYCDILLDDLPKEGTSRNDVEEIKKAAESAGSLTRQLLAFSRQQILEPRVLTINEVALKVESILRRLIGEHIDLRLRLEAAAGRIKADAGQIEQVLLNLVINARDAMGTGGALTVETGTSLAGPPGVLQPPPAPHGYVTLTVRDTGPGIAPEVKPHLFQPFFTTKRHGTGLGLSTVHDIVTQSGGCIIVESEPGQGATFRIYLPRVEAEFHPSGTSNATVPPRGTETVLLAEDNDSLRELVHKVLERSGYRVLPAANAEDAREIAARQTEPIDLLLTDVVMPGASGPALAGDLVRMLPELKVLYMTGYIDDGAGAAGIGLTSLLQKPFSPAVLLERVRDVLDEN